MLVYSTVLLLVLFPIFLNKSKMLALCADVCSKLGNYGSNATYYGKNIMHMFL